MRKLRQLDLPTGTRESVGPGSTWGLIHQSTLSPRPPGAPLVRHLTFPCPPSTPSPVRGTLLAHVPTMLTPCILVLIPLSTSLKLSPSASVPKGPAYLDFEAESKTHI